MTRYLARWICPVSAPPIEHGALVETHGRIEFVGRAHDAPSDANTIDLGDAILIPGLVNAHCHLELTVMRGFLEGLSFREWILRLTAARRAVLTPEMLLDSSRLGIEEGLRFGVTTFADTGDSGAGFDAMLERGVRGICFREVFGPDPRQSDAAIADLDAKVTVMLERETERVRVGVSPHAPYTVSDELFVATAALAARRRLPVAVHVAESQIESDLVSGGHGAFADGLRKRDIAVASRARTPIALLGRTGVLDCKPVLIHCIRVDDEDIHDIVTHDCGVAHCPASNAKLGQGVAPVTALLAAGTRLGLGSDSVASNNRMAMLDEARLAALMAAAREQRHDVMSATTALELATIGGARALGMDARIGTLEIGKSADLAAFSMQPERAPISEPAGALIYAMAGAPAAFVAVQGDVMVRNGVLVRHDPTLSDRVQRASDRLREWQSSLEQ